MERDSTRRPSFFIVGAPKCGTTALSEYLRAHPEGLLRVDSRREYLALFAHAPSGTRIFGEASATYLYSTVASARIREFESAAKIIVMLRNPIDLAHALHSQLLYNRTEDEPEFERAWRLQSERSAGRRIPRLCREPRLLQYHQVALLGQQTERLLATFPRRQILFIFHTDLIADTSAVYGRVLDFLGLPPDAQTDFPRINANRGVHSPRLARLTQHPPRVLMRAASATKRILGLSRFGFLDPLRRINSRPEQRPALTAAFRTELIDLFRPDVNLLSVRLGRDLSDWLQEPRDENESTVGVEPGR
jgi:hypothetical protein